MIKKERKTLHLIKKHFAFSEMVLLDTDHCVMISDDVSIPFPYNDMDGIIRSLAKKDLLVLSDHPLQTYFSLTYEGYNRFLILADNFRTSFFTKWIPGFISGVITAVVAELIIFLALHSSLLSGIQ